MASTYAWPPPPAAYRSFAPLPKDGGQAEEAAAHWPPPPPPPGDGDTYTAFGTVHHNTPPPLELHAPLVFDPAAEPRTEVRRLNGALRVLYAQLVGALADGSTEYDGVVHNIRVVLSNLHYLASSLREPQAVDALAHAFQQQAQQLQEAGTALRLSTEEAVRVEAAARETLQSLALLPLP